MTTDHQTLLPDMDSAVNQNISRYNSFIQQSIQRHTNYTDILLNTIGNGIVDGACVIESGSDLTLEPNSKFITGDCFTEYKTNILPLIDLTAVEGNADRLVVLHEIDYENDVDLVNDNYSASGISVPMEQITEKVNKNITVLQASLNGSEVVIDFPNIHWTENTITFHNIIGNTAISTTPVSFMLNSPVKYEIKECADSGDIFVSPADLILLQDTTLGPTYQYVPEICYNRLAYATVLCVLKKINGNWIIDDSVSHISVGSGGVYKHFNLAKIRTRSIGVNGSNKNDDKTYSIKDFVIVSEDKTDYSTIKTTATEGIRPESDESSSIDSSRYDSALIDGGIVNVLGTDSNKENNGELGSIRSKNNITKNILSSNGVNADYGNTKTIDVLNDDGSANNSYLEEGNIDVTNKTALSGLIVTPTIIIPRGNNGAVQDELKIYYVDDDGSLKDGKVLTHLNEDFIETLNIVYKDSSLPFDRQEVQISARVSHKISEVLIDRDLYSTVGDFDNTQINTPITFELEDNNIVFNCNNDSKGQELFDSIEQNNIEYVDIKNQLREFFLYNYKDPNTYHKILELDLDEISIEQNKVKIKNITNDSISSLYLLDTNISVDQKYNVNYLNYKTGEICLRFVSLNPPASFGNTIHIHADYSCFPSIINTNDLQYGNLKLNRITLEETKYKDEALVENTLRPELNFISYEKDTNNQEVEKKAVKITGDKDGILVETIKKDLINDTTDSDYKLQFNTVQKIEIGNYDDKTEFPEGDYTHTKSKLERSGLKVVKYQNNSGTITGTKSAVEHNMISVRSIDDQENPTGGIEISYGEIVLKDKYNPLDLCGKFYKNGFGYLKNRLAVGVNAIGSGGSGTGGTGRRIKLDKDALYTYSSYSTEDSSTTMGTTGMTFKLDYETGDMTIGRNLLVPINLQVNNTITTTELNVQDYSYAKGSLCFAGIVKYKQYSNNRIQIRQIIDGASGYITESSSYLNINNSLIYFIQEILQKNVGNVLFGLLLNISTIKASRIIVDNNGYIGAEIDPSFQDMDECLLQLYWK